MKIKKEDYENIYDCIVTDQMPPDMINEYFQDKNFYRYYIIRRRQDDWRKRWNTVRGVR